MTALTLPKNEPLTESERMEIAKRIDLANEFGFPIEIDPMTTDGDFQLVSVKPPKDPPIVLGGYRPARIDTASGEVIHPGLFTGAGFFHGRLLEGPWEAVLKDLWMYVHGLTRPRPPKAVMQ